MNVQTVMCLVLLVGLTYGLEDPVVEAAIGKIKGRIMTDFDNLTLETFLGIPYAKPPVGKLRFEYPVEFENLEGDLDAKNFSVQCAQPAVYYVHTFSEDCLYLNIFRPIGTHKSSRIPVLVVIYGDAFAYGSSADTLNSGAHITALGNIIVVTFNYRLGIFGFGDMGDAAPGNLGLYDQQLALQWTKKNIASFGGDPNKVTLIGSNSGAMAITAHMRTAASGDKNLFQAVILDAGAMTGGPVVSSEVSLSRMKKIAQAVSCPTEGTEMVNCLRNVDVKTLTDHSVDANYSRAYTFLPTVDGKFIVEDMEKDMQENPEMYAKVKMIAGTAMDEGTFLLPWGYRLPLGLILPLGLHDFRAECIQRLDDVADHCQNLAYGYKVPLDINNSDEFWKIVTDTYMRKYNDSAYRAVVEFVGDAVVVCPVNTFVRSYSKLTKDIYVYRFERAIQTHKPYPPFADGVYHSMPYEHFLGMFLPLVNVINPDDKKFIIDNLMMIAEFVKTQEPPKFRGMVWPDYAASQEVFVLDDSPSIRNSLPHSDECSKIFK